MEALVELVLPFIQNPLLWTAQNYPSVEGKNNNSSIPNKRCYIPLGRTMLKLEINTSKYLVDPPHMASRSNIIKFNI